MEVDGRIELHLKVFAALINELARAARFTNICYFYILKIWHFAHLRLDLAWIAQVPALNRLDGLAVVTLNEYLLLSTRPNFAIVRKFDDWLTLVVRHQVREPVNFWYNDVARLEIIEV